jgi:esterase
MPLRLAAVEYGAGTQPPVVILHGLFGSAGNWATIARRLAEQRRVVALDLRNHGNSPWAHTISYSDMAEDVFATSRALGLGRFALIGHSMGGKAAMAAALAHPAEVERLVVVDIAPVAYAPGHLGYVRAMRALDLSAVRRRGDADAALADVVPGAAERAFLLQNLVFEAGGARWRINLAAIEQAMRELAGFPPQPPGAVYRGPALFVAGENSDFLLPAHEPAIKRLFPHARIARADNAGHWLHAEQPEAFLDLAAPFLAGS